MATILFDRVGSVTSFVNHLKELEKSCSCVIILSCDNNEFTPFTIDSSLRSSTLDIMGAIFPSIIYNNKKYDDGTIFIGLKDKVKIRIIEDISTKKIDKVDKELDEYSDEFTNTVNTIFVFIDGLAKNIDDNINRLFDNYGVDVNYIGGGSGSLSFKQKPSLFTNRGLLQDSMLYACSRLKSAIGVSHGYKSVDGPYEVTKVDKTVIKELDYKPAFEVYKKVVDNNWDVKINKENFFEIAKSFPFGINTISDEKIVRDPIILDGTDIVCVGKLEEGSYVDILNGNAQTLIDAASQAKATSLSLMDSEVDFTLFIDCISRALFLEDDFYKELEVVYDKDTTLIGALSFGEIANHSKSYLEFYNKTAVIGQFSHE